MGTLINDFNAQINSGATPVKATGSSSASSSGMGTIASGVISGLSDIATGFINAGRIKNTYKFNEGMVNLQNSFNEGMAQLQTRMMKLSASVAIGQIREKALSLYGEQRAAYARAGVKMQGSPAEVMLDSLKNAELDVIYNQINADYGVSLVNTQTGINTLESQSALAIKKMEAKSAQYDIYQGMLKSILNMGVKTYSRG